jgi:hypothetical protein
MKVIRYVWLSCYLLLSVKLHLCTYENWQVWSKFISFCKKVESRPLVDDTSLVDDNVQACSNLLRTACISLVGTTCRKSVTIIKMLTTCFRLVTTTGNKQCEHILMLAWQQPSYNMFANLLINNCCQADIRMCSHCLFPVVVTSLEQLVIILLLKIDDGNRLTRNKGNSNALWKTIRQCLPKDRPADRVSQKPPEVLADDLNTFIFFYFY